jgi:hypothetical protein
MMADIFISYDSDDRQKASLIGAKLAERHYSVWWDRHLIIGEDYYDRIEAELEASKAVVVVWSSRSVRSPWVKAEANRGARSNRLLPVIIDDCTIPLRFEILQSADLRDWRGGGEHPEWQKLLNQLSVLVPRVPAAASTGLARHQPATTARLEPERVLPQVARRVVEFLADPAGGGPTRIYAVFREFPEFAEAKMASDLWFGLGSREALFRRLCEIEPRLVSWQNTGGAWLLKLAGTREAELEPDVAPPPATTGSPMAPPAEKDGPRIDDVISYVARLLAGSPVVIPLASVATAIEAEFGDGVRKSRWLGCKTLKGLVVQHGKAHNLMVGGQTGYLYDPTRHTPPTN